MSDHGFSEIKKIFYVNTYLLSKGLLRLNDQLAILRQKLILHLIRIAKRLSKMGLLPISLLSGFKLSKESKLAFDVKKSKCYMYSHTSSGITINVDTEREKDIIRSMLIAELNSLRDEDGSKVLEAIPKEKLYGGQANNIPDIILKFEKGYAASEFIIPPDMIARKNFLLPPNEGPSFRKGEHTSDGILIIYNGNVKSRELKARVEDIFPTILYLYNIPIPKWIDGKVLTEVFKDEFVRKHRVKHSKFELETIKAIKKIQKSLP